MLYYIYMAVIEIEKRGLIQSEDYQNITDKLKQDGTFKETKRRLLIDYSVFLEDDISERTLDIRIRETNGTGEIVIKEGHWGGQDQRTENNVLVQDGQFLELAKTMALLGYKKGILAIRKTQVYDYKGVEVALVEVPGHSHYFEAEIESDVDGDLEALAQQVDSVAEELGLSYFTDEEFYVYLRDLNEKANTVYDYDQKGMGAIEEHQTKLQNI